MLSVKLQLINFEMRTYSCLKKTIADAVSGSRRLRIFLTTRTLSEMRRSDATDVGDMAR